MNALDTTREILRIIGTTGLSKEVIELLEKKLAILTSELSDAQRKIATLQIENTQLRTQLQNLHPVGFQKSMGVLWKRTAKGFESAPYCPECPSHPVMMGFPPGSPDMWACPSNNHTFDYALKPPSA